MHRETNASEHFSPAEDDDGDDRGQEGDAQQHPEPDGAALKGHGDVHAPDRGDERGDGEHQRQRGQDLHDVVDVVVDDGGEGVHRGGEDVAYVVFQA